MSSYTSPPWAREPQHQWTLTEIKGGVEQAVYPLTKPCTLLGRAADQVDIALQHESASRQHARIAFDGTTPWLRDLASTHGVTVNKKRLPAAAIGKTESNSTKAGARGVVLYPGDILQFGASTRIYCVDGPAEFARGAIRKIEPKIINNSSTTTGRDTESTAKRQEEDRSEGVSWGIMDAEDDPASENSVTEGIILNDDNIPEKHRKEWEKIKALQYKLQNIQSESERIRVKANSTELSAGQERQLERNDERIAKLQEQISERKAELHRKVYPSNNHQASSMSRRRAVHDAAGAEEDDVDFYDRTKEDTSSQLELDRDGETEETLIAKWENLRQQQDTVLADLGRCKQKVVQHEQRVAYLKAKDDEESFFAQNDLDLAKDSLQKIEVKKQSLEKQMTEAEELLQIANADLTLNRETGRIHRIGEDLSSTKGNDDNSTKQPPKGIASGAEVVTTQEQEEAILPPPRVKTAEAAASDNFSMPPPSKKRQRVVGPMMPPPSKSMDTIVPPISDGKKKKARQPVVGTLAALSSMTSTTTTSSKAANNMASTNTQDVLTNKATGASAPLHNGTEDVWQAPKDQDGSGITKLNAKFGGRY